MAAAAHRDGQIVIATEPDGVGDVGRIVALDDDGGMPIDHSVEDGAGLVVPGVAGDDGLACQLLAKTSERGPPPRLGAPWWPPSEGATRPSHRKPEGRGPIG